MKRRGFQTAAALVAAALLFVACLGGKECPRYGASCVAPRSTATQSGSTQTPTLSAAEWKRIGDAPAPARQEVAAAVLGGRVYIVGGLVADGGATKEVWAFAPSDGVWSRVADLPIALHHAMAVPVNDQLVVLGGFTGDLGGRASARVFSLSVPNAPTARWGELPPMRHPRAAGAAITLNDDRILVLGGISSGRHVAPTEILGEDRDRASIPTPRDHIAASSDGRRVYVAGGRRSGEHLYTFEAYDIAADRWQRLPNMPTARSGLGATMSDGMFVTVGGEGPRIFPEVEAYDVARMRWRRLPDLAVPVHGLAVEALVQETVVNLYAFMGGVRVGLAPSRAVQVLRLSF